MTKKEIIYWRNKYNREEDLGDKSLKTLEKRLGRKFKKNKLVAKSDLIEIVKWKFQSPQLVGRRKLILGYIAKNRESIIKEKTKLAFDNKDDGFRLKKISELKGVGYALSTVILSFYDPKNYGVLDIHAWRELFGREPKDLFSKYKYTIKFIRKLRKISNKTKLPCRDIEKALFKKNLDQG